MKAILFILGVILLVVGGIYLMMPANALPTFFPGYNSGLASIHLKHGLAAGGLGIVSILAGWLFGQKG